MAYTPHVLFAMGGSWINDNTEIWECTVRLQANGGGGVTLDCGAYLTDISNDVQSWFEAGANYTSSSATLKWIKANHVDAAGHYVDSTTTHVFDYSGTIVGINPDRAPGFCSLAYTWETANARGPGHRGRIYPPNNTFVTTSSAFKVNDAARDYNATAATQLLIALQNRGGADGRKGVPVVASKVNGAIVPIIGATSDNIYDVQRRRKNRIVGTRSAVHVPA